MGWLWLHVTTVRISGAKDWSLILAVMLVRYMKGCRDMDEQRECKQRTCHSDPSLGKNT